MAGVPGAAQSAKITTPDRTTSANSLEARILENLIKQPFHNGLKYITCLWESKTKVPRPRLLNKEPAISSKWTTESYDFAMKSCPACLTQYTDDTLRYCLQDGNPLIASSLANEQTIVMGETNTLVNPRPGQQALDTRQDIRVPSNSDLPRAKRRSRFGLVAAVAASVILVIFGALGLGALIYLKNRDSTPKNSIRSDNAPDKTPARAESSPTATQRVANSPTLGLPPSPSLSAVDSDLREKIVSEINSWRETTEEMDVDSLMDRYASKVDYYNKKGVAIDFIRNDKRRAFSRFDGIDMKLSNFEVSKNPAGDKVTVLFDKEWRFTGERTSTGKVRQLLELTKFGSNWLITAERDLKVY
jgi:hypothetical protein